MNKTEADKAYIRVFGIFCVYNWSFALIALCMCGSLDACACDHTHLDDKTDDCIKIMKYNTDNI